MTLPMKEEDEIPEKLNRLKASADGFQVPEGFFENLSDEVWKKIQQAQVEAKPLRSSLSTRMDQWLRTWFLPQPGLALALASLAILLIAALFWFNSPGSVQAQLAQVDKASVKSYVLSNIDEFEEESILELAKEAQKTGDLLPELPNTEIQQYLDDAVNELDEELLEEVF
jgi:hypothetical protein